MGIARQQSKASRRWENIILADREVICDVFHKRPNVGEHVLLLIGFDRNRQVFLAKNHWGEGAFIASPKSRHQRSHV